MGVEFVVVSLLVAVGVFAYFYVENTRQLSIEDIKDRGEGEWLEFTLEELTDITAQEFHGVYLDVWDQISRNEALMDDLPREVLQSVVDNNKEYAELAPHNKDKFRRYAKVLLSKYGWI